MTLEEMEKMASSVEAEQREQIQNVDALLATTCSRLLAAASQVNEMRFLHQCQDVLRYWQTATAAAEHLIVAGHAITEAHRILLKKDGVITGTQQGGLIH